MPKSHSPPSQAPGAAGLTFPALGGPLSSPGSGGHTAQMLPGAPSGPPVPPGN